MTSFINLEMNKKIKIMSSTFFFHFPIITAILFNNVAA